MAGIGQHKVSLEVQHRPIGKGIVAAGIIPVIANTLKQISLSIVVSISESG